MNRLESVNKLDEYFSKGDWISARKLLLKELRRYPSDSWSITRLSFVYFNEGKYSKALEMSQKAYSIDPYDPVVLWDYARALYENNRIKESIRLLKFLLPLSAKSLFAKGYSKNWSSGIQNDCRFWIAVGYIHLDKLNLAEKYFRLHLANRKRGRPTECSIKEARNFLKCINKIKEETKNNEMRLWISLVEIKLIHKQNKSNFKGAYTNGLVKARSAHQAKSILKKELEKEDYQVVSFEDTEELDKRCMKSEIDHDLKRKATKALKSGTAQFGSFYYWK